MASFGAVMKTEGPSSVPQTLILGLGATGLSVARHLQKRGQSFAVLDTRENPPGLSALASFAHDAQVRLGEFDGDFLSQAERLILSPGVAVSEPAVQAAARNGVEILGDIELFAREVKAPVIAVTGSNGKSTVTSLLGHMAARAGRKVKVGANLGTPALDLLDPEADLYVLELSSFQLETTSSLRLEAAVVLNVSEDHMDRYDSLESYAAAKQRVYAHAAHAIVNR